MEWYVPLTVLPAIGLLIMSTTHFIVALNSEIIDLEKAEVTKKDIVLLKLGQLKKLGIANACFYAASLFFLLAGLSAALFPERMLLDYFMIIGVFITTAGLTFLFIHSMKSVKIRQQNLKPD